MSFITKRERVFKDFAEPVELPPRNEGKLKAYASCTDARAWSHFCSDKTDHLVEIMKRNNVTFRGKYVPVTVIVDMMLSAQKGEVARLKRKIGQLELMLTSYDQLDLNCEQKCQISLAHTMIKQANKSLDTLPPLDLDLSNFSEALDSERFQTGKSGGDGQSSVTSRGSGAYSDRIYSDREFKEKKDQGLEFKVSTASKLNQSYLERCDASTCAYDNRLDELKESLITKDAKLNAMQNTLAVMENDVCEPYCIYAHIYTALEKIFGTLRQNDKYRLFLDLMCAGREVACVDIKGKILLKLKVLEKFSIALIAPCSENFKYNDSCECYPTQINLNENFASTEVNFPNQPQSIKSELIAEVLEDEFLKKFIEKDKDPVNAFNRVEDILISDNCSIDSQNLNRLKSLQIDYDELMNAYEVVRNERDNLRVRLTNCEKLDKELEDCRTKLREYKMVYDEKEYYRIRSEELDMLKKQVIVLADENSSLETQLKTETEINHIKTETLEDMRSSNMSLENKLSHLSIAFEKERNSVLCQLKEADCKIMCQEQQIRSLTAQIDRLLENDKPHDVLQSAMLMDENEALKYQINSLTEGLSASEDDKQRLQKQFEDQLKLINDLKLEIEEWKSNFGKTLQKNEYLEKYAEGFKDEIHKLIKENKFLSEAVEEKKSEVESLKNVIHGKSGEINRLIEHVESKSNENIKLIRELEGTRDKYESSIVESEIRKDQVTRTLLMARKESVELFDKVNSYEELLRKTEDLSQSLLKETESCNELRNMLLISKEEKKKLQEELSSQENNNKMLLQEIQRLRDLNSCAAENINTLQKDNEQYQNSLQATKKESENLENKLKELEYLEENLKEMRKSQEKLLSERDRLENELNSTSQELDHALCSVQLTNRESKHLLDKIKHSENIKEDLINLSNDYYKLNHEKEALQNEIIKKNLELAKLSKILFEQKAENEELIQKCDDTDKLKKMYQELLKEKDLLQKDFDNRTSEIDILYSTLEGKIEENRILVDKMKEMEKNILKSNSQFEEIQAETQNKLETLKKESEIKISKECEELKQANETLNNKIKTCYREKESLENDIINKNKDLDDLSTSLSQLQAQNKELLQNAKNFDELRQAYDDLLKENVKLQSDLDNSSVAVLDLNNRLKNKIEENTVLLDKIKSMERNYVQNKQEFEDIQIKTQNNLELLRKQSEGFINKLQNYESLQKEYEELKESKKKIEQERDNLKFNLEKQLENIKNIKAEKDDWQTQAHQLKAQNEGLEKTVTGLIETTPEKPYYKALKDIEDMRKEKLSSNKRIKELLDELDEKDNIISKLNEDVNSRVDKIATLENHINALEEEVKELHKSLEQMINTGEQLKDNSIKKIDQTLTKMEAHHSKATHNMKMELARLENQKAVLEEQLSISKIKSDESLRDNHKYMSQVMHLQNEKEALVTCIKQLELSCVGDSNLSPDYCSVEEVMSSLDKIRICVEARNSKSTNLEQTLLKVQTSSQLLLSKADEAKRIVEKEKQKIIKEKEEAIADRINMEKQVSDLKVQFEEQIAHDKALIKDLESEILNQKLIIDKLDQSTKSRISELENHIKSLNDMYQNAATKVTALQETLDEVSKSNKDNLQILEKTKFDLLNKSKEVFELQTKLNELKNKSVKELEIQTAQNCQNVETQTEKIEVVKDEFDVHTDVNKSAYNQEQINEVQILTACIEPSMDYIKTQYAEYKKNKLNNSKIIITDSESDRHSNTRANLILENNDKKEVVTSEIEVKEQDTIIESHLFDNLSVAKRIHSDTIIQLKSKLEPSKQADKIKAEDVFLIYKDSDSGTNEKSLIENNINTNGRSQEHSEEAFIMKSNLMTFTRQQTKRAKESLQVKTSIEMHTDLISNNPLVSSETNTKKQIEQKNTLENFAQPKETLRKESPSRENFALRYIFESVPDEMKLNDLVYSNEKLHKSRSEDLHLLYQKNRELSAINKASNHSKWETEKVTPSQYVFETPQKDISVASTGVMASIDAPDYYEHKLHEISQQLERSEKDYKKKVEAIKAQYDNNIKDMIKEHNLGVKSIQNLHEETLQDIIKSHENEVESLRTMSIEAMRKVEKLEKLLDIKSHDCNGDLNQDAAKIDLVNLIRNKSVCGSTKVLTKTHIEEFHVKPKIRDHGPCTCSLDVNLSDTIRNIFEQVNVDQRKIAEQAYMKYIANKILSGFIESLDIHELSFLHFKVCRSWKNKLGKEEVLQKRIETIENKLFYKKRSTQQHIAELDRKVAEERRLLEEAREAVCPCAPDMNENLLLASSAPHPEIETYIPFVPNVDALPSSCFTGLGFNINEHLGISPGLSEPCPAKRRPNRPKQHSTLPVGDVEEHREDRRIKRMYDELPTRLRRAHERSSRAPRK